MHIICNWRAILGDEVIRGEHHMRAVSVRPKSFFNGCPVHATASYPSTLVHDFSKGPAVRNLEFGLLVRVGYAIYDSIEFLTFSILLLFRWFLSP